MLSVFLVHGWRPTEGIRHGDDAIVKGDQPGAPRREGHQPQEKGCREKLLKTSVPP